MFSHDSQHKSHLCMSNIALAPRVVCVALAAVARFDVSFYSQRIVLLTLAADIRTHTSFTAEKNKIVFRTSFPFRDRALPCNL